MNFDYQIRRSARAKNTRLVVKPDKIEVVAPPHVSEKQIKAFVIQHQDWLRQAVQRVTDKASANSLAPSEYRDGVLVPFQDNQLLLNVSVHSAKTLKVHHLASDDQLLVKLPISLATEQHSDNIRHALSHWMKRQAQQQAQLLIEKHAPRFGLYPRSLRIKTQKSRWGSCGPNNDINLNWLLMLAPAAALEYVVVHELCHIKHKNHSAAFWQLVAEHLPNYQQQRHWLKQHGARVMQGL